MHVTLVNVLVKPAHTENFIAATRLNHKASIQEPGNCRFDVLQSPENPSLLSFMKPMTLPRLRRLTSKHPII